MILIPCRRHLRKEKKDEQREIKILCISDHVDPLIYSAGLKKRHSDIDLVISAGDLDLNYYSFIVSSLNKPLLFVFGNHNLKHIAEYRIEYRSAMPPSKALGLTPGTCGSTYIGDRVLRIQGLLIAGLGGSYNYNGGRNQFSEAGMFFKIIKLLPSLLFNRIFRGRWLDILVSHAPPYGINDREDRCHRGFKTFLVFLKIFKPLYHIHGHIHLYDINEKRVSHFHDTEVINVYNNYILEVHPHNVR